MVDLKIFLSLAKPNQCSQSKYQPGFGVGQEIPKLHDCYNYTVYSTNRLNDGDQQCNVAIVILHNCCTNILPIHT